MHVRESHAVPRFSRQHAKIDATDVPCVFAVLRCCFNLFCVYHLFTLVSFHDLVPTIAMPRPGKFVSHLRNDFSRV